jgi:hypothetical protein
MGKRRPVFVRPLSLVAGQSELERWRRQIGDSVWLARAFDTIAGAQFWDSSPVWRSPRR